MKVSGKPISSPGRTDKFPPPLMRFLRTNIGNKSRKATTTPRSRSSPMFLRKRSSGNSNPSAASIETTQEPSSPKVTCMGQVRVRKMSSKPRRARAQSSRKTETFVSCRCPWLTRALFCRQIRPKISWPVLGEWGSFFRRKPGNRDESKIESQSKLEDEEEEEELTGEEDSEEDELRHRHRPRPSVFMAESDTVVVPIPKNALILTRCRSAPYRSSSLASRFWESPLKSEEEEKQSNEKVNHENAGEESDEEELPISEKPTESNELRDSKRLDEKEEVDDDHGDEQNSGGGELGTGLAILTRCKSEPARLVEKLYPESVYLKNNCYRRRTISTTTTRSGFANSCD